MTENEALRKSNILYREKNMKLHNIIDDALRLAKELQDSYGNLDKNETIELIKILERKNKIKAL